MFIDPLDIPSHRVIGNEVDFVSPLGKIFCPALGMDAASVSDEAEDHGVITPGSRKIEYVGIIIEIAGFLLLINFSTRVLFLAEKITTIW